MSPKKEIFLCVDWKQSKKVKFWLQSELEKIEYKVTLLDIPNYSMKNITVRWRKIILWLQYFQLAFRVFFLSSRKHPEWIIAWNAVNGVFVCLIFKLFRRIDTKIGVLNLIVHDKSLLLMFLRKLIYTYSLKRATFISVNHTIYATGFSKKFKVPLNKFKILQDAVKSDEFNYTGINNSNNYDVFSGGEAKRDWETLFNAAVLNPEISFCVVARRKTFNIAKVPPNVDLHFDLNSEEFYEKMKKSKIVVLPLKGSMTAGLLVLTKAMLMGKAVIATKTVTTENYIVSGKNGLFVEEGDYEDLAQKIHNLLYNEGYLINLGLEARRSILKNHTEHNYSESLTSILKSNERHWHCK
ncbi:MAG: glycosyltransferase [bacterium]|nr:glycosyltransferase [bacterium]